MFTDDSGLCEVYVAMKMNKWGIILMCCFVWLIYIKPDAQSRNQLERTIRAKMVDYSSFGLWVIVWTEDGRKLKIPMSSIAGMEEEGYKGE